MMVEEVVMKEMAAKVTMMAVVMMMAEMVAMKQRWQL